MAAGSGYCLIVLRGEVLALLTFQQLIDVRDHRADFADEEHVRPQIENLFRDIAIDPIHERHHRNYRSHADYYAKQRENGAQLIRPQGLQRNTNGFYEIHEVRRWQEASSCRKPK